MFIYYDEEEASKFFQQSLEQATETFITAVTGSVRNPEHYVKSHLRVQSGVIHCPEASGLLGTPSPFRSASAPFVVSAIIGPEHPALVFADGEFVYALDMTKLENVNAVLHHKLPTLVEAQEQDLLA